MKKRLYPVLTLATCLLIGSTAFAQQCSTCNQGAVVAGSACGGGCLGGGSGVLGPDGLTTTTCPGTCSGYPPRPYALLYAARDHFSPHPLYTYGRGGIDAARTNEWNQRQQQMYPWNGQYGYWRYNQPTALVVPPTAAFQSEYNWGVGQTRSLPIYHQFGFNNPGVVGGAAGQYPWAPYNPASTSQYGVYPVRGPWN